jgi:hypothetical protein
MNFTLKKKIVAGAAVAALALGAGGAAFAYWTASGSGSSTGTVASSNGALTLHASFPATTLYPGDSEVVSFTADNAGAQAVAVGTVHSVVTVDSTHTTAGCLAADFSVADVIENQSIAATTTATALAHAGSIVMSNTNVSQDACKGATLTLTLSS